ncbi:hypothetical protein [Streptomyces gobiensis]|uniref:hypothetical protein n=1 Tax=Streptomyces gobiensis TaxID=2875706 RepID=UPI0030CE10D4
MDPDPTASGDEIHWSRANPHAARAMLLAGALATRARVGYHGSRHRRQAEALTDRVRLVPAADGRQLAARVPVEDGRGVVTTLRHALHATRDALDQQRATGRPDAFGPAVEAGVSQELAEALSTLLCTAERVRITLRWSPAHGAPPGCPARPAAVEFTAADLPALQQAGKRYIRAEPSVPVRVTGAVVRLRRALPAGPGAVRLRVLAGAEVPQVRIALGEDDYRIAAHAHLTGLPVRVCGRLESRGGFRRITGATGVAPVPVSGTGRDRVLKSAHESLGLFEGACEGLRPPGP